MKIPFATIFCAVSTLVCSASPAFAGAIKLSCASASEGVTVADVSSYDVGLTQALSIGSGTSGAGGGKITFNPADIHVQLADFQRFLPFVENGTHFTSCTLSDTTGTNAIEYEFNLAIVGSIDAVRSLGANRSDVSYADLKLEFGALEVHTSRSIPGKFE